MKKLLLTTVAFAALGMAPAVAADLAARTYTKAPAMAPLPSWAGFYIGGMGGYATEDSGSPKIQGGFAGGTVGYNWQTANWVYGLEADAAWADINASAAGAAVIPGLGLVGVTASDKINSTGTVRGRIGYAFNTVLLYATGGYAWANNKLSIGAPALGLSASQEKFLSGWTVGAGVEVMFAPKWSVKGEYLYKSFDGQTFFGVPTGDLNLHSVQVGINYHF